MKNLPQGWEWGKLGEITECLDGKRIPLNSKERELRRGNIPYYGTNGQVDSVNDYIFDEELLLLAEDGGSWGRNEKCSYIINGKSWVNNHAHVLRMKSSVMIKFLEAYLNLSDLTAYISGTTRGKLNQRRMNEIKIPLPSLPVQKQIVSILERAEKLKEKRKHANDETSKLLQSIFLEMFGDPINVKSKNKLSDFVKLSSGKFNPTKNLNDSYLYPAYGGNGVTGFSKDYLVEDSTIVIGRVGAYCGCVHLTKPKSWITDNAIYLSKFDKDNIKLIYLYHLFLNLKISRFADISGQPKITQRPILEIPVIAPPIELQNQFALIVEKVESLKENQQKSTEDINQLFDALMQKAFNGELAG